MSESEIAALLEEWNEALQTGDPKKVAGLYDTEGILVPTLSNKVRHNHAEIEDYFVHFLAKGPVASVDEANIRVYGDIAINSGIYTFAMKDGSSVQGRFSFVYRRNGGRWQILEHHSSLMPE